MTDCTKCTNCEECTRFKQCNPCINCLGAPSTNAGGIVGGNFCGVTITSSNRSNGQSGSTSQNGPGSAAKNHTATSSPHIDRRGGVFVGENNDIVIANLRALIEANRETTIRSDDGEVIGTTSIRVDDYGHIHVDNNGTFTSNQR
ncbi:unnamed protein product [Clonostachys rosea]|uniref:Pectate lyase n=1 Tax=Bionectria ochroleuca TaxID=29856 RepID=A0ABY6TU46_BIOOC|nr:unnamed protein product [Clonostachys rosea]